MCVDVNSAREQQNILGISSSIWYDKLTHLLYARCHAMGPNVGSLLLATDYLSNKLKDYDLNPCIYKEYVMASFKHKKYLQMKRALKQNITELGCMKQQYEKCANVYHPQWGIVILNRYSK